MLAQGNEELSTELLHLRVVHHLLYAMGNQSHADAQRQASLALEVRGYTRTHTRTYIHAGDYIDMLLFSSGIALCPDLSPG